jgi:hypothetical protein
MVIDVRHVECVEVCPLYQLTSYALALRPVMVFVCLLPATGARYRTHSLYMNAGLEDS